MYRVSPFVRHFGLALLGGAAMATLWVNLAPASYYDAIEWRLLDLSLPAWLAPVPVSLTPLTIVSDGLMALFLFFVGKELWEALVLERGALAGRQGIMPLGAVLGAALGAVLVWVLGGALWETAEEAGRAAGWPVPIGGDVVLAYLVGRRVFGAGHPALHLLLLITISLDLLGLLVIGLAYPPMGLRLAFVAAAGLVVAGLWAGFGRHARPGASERARRRAMALWPYVLGGGLSFAAIAASGLPPALGLLPLIPVIPHADRAFGLFAEAEEFLHDPLNRLAHLMVRPLALVLFLFGLVRGGIDLAAFAPTTLTVLAAFWIGKPLGLLAGVLAAGAVFRATLPAGVRFADIGVIATLSGLGFTVPLLAIDPALPGGAMAEAARLGLGLTLLAGLAALALGRGRSGR